MKTLTILLLTLLLTGCATMQPATRDTWAGGELDRLQSAHQSCIVEVNQAHAPMSNVVFLNPLTVPFGVASHAITPSRRTRYKDCMERNGYTKLQSEKVPSNEKHFGELSPFWVESPCSRQPNQTCMIESGKPKCSPPTVFFDNRCASEEQYRAHQEWIKSIPSPAFYKEERK